MNPWKGRSGLRYWRASARSGLPSKAIWTNIATGPINGGRSAACSDPDHEAGREVISTLSQSKVGEFGLDYELLSWKQTRVALAAEFGLRSLMGATFWHRLNPDDGSRPGVESILDDVL